ncbi:hypothetical protein [Companilactobacillus furfuricola]|uniref:hypothetical protein n=1 Tax=Companilactobacillus furfuricola TaxID=1462575 RepID=UPI000F7A58F4|nr:hypothetical protein [Companilactobacillus furfuricola]
MDPLSFLLGGSFFVFEFEVFRGGSLGGGSLPVLRGVPEIAPWNAMGTTLSYPKETASDISELGLPLSSFVAKWNFMADGEFPPPHAEPKVVQKSFFGRVTVLISTQVGCLVLIFGPMFFMVLRSWFLGSSFQFLLIISLKLFWKTSHSKQVRGFNLV